MDIEQLNAAVKIIVETAVKSEKIDTYVDIGTLVVIVADVIVTVILAIRNQKLTKIQSAEFEPNAVADIVTRDINIKGAIFRTLFIMKGGIADIGILMRNLSRGLTKFKLTVTAWFVNSEGVEIILDDYVDGGIYRGEEPQYFAFRDEIQGHFTIDFRKVEPRTYTPDKIKQSSLDQDYFKLELIKKPPNGKLHIEIFIDYLNEKIGKQPRLYTLYYTADNTSMGPTIGNDLVISGDWVFGGRNEKSRHPKAK